MANCLARCLWRGSPLRSLARRFAHCKSVGDERGHLGYSETVAIYALSDLHITSNSDAIYLATLRFLKSVPVSGDTVVLGGDIFDLFVGDKQLFRDRYSEFFTALRSLLGNGVEFHYIEGNHDFHLSGALERTSNPAMSVQLHHARVELERAGKRFLFEHGDLVDREDLGYLVLRATLRSPLIRAVVASAPSSLIDLIGQKSSEASSKRSRQPSLEKREKIQLTYRNFAVTKLTQGFDYVVLGHCHQADHMRFQCGSRVGEYWNMGYPKESFEVLAWSELDGMYRIPLK
jgi:UDP-2,3-diacylglucosamine hydrolase